MKETKELLALGIALANGVAAALEDGKVDWKDALKLVPVAKRIKDGLAGLENIDDEIQEMSDDDSAELVAWAREEFDIPNDDVEQIVEAALDTALSLVRTAMLLKKTA